jgi:vancomycin resistance protein VanJ
MSESGHSASPVSPTSSSPPGSGSESEPPGAHQTLVLRDISTPVLRSVIGLTSTIATWTWALLVLAALLLIRCVGERWWGVTVLLFVPRWLFLAPLPILMLGSGLGGRPKQWLVQGAVALVVAGPLMLISLPLHRLWAGEADGYRLRIMTFNQSPHPLDEARLIRLIERERVDILCFQEIDPGRHPVLDEYLSRGGWYRDRARYLATRYPIVAELPPLPRIEPTVTETYPVSMARVRIEVGPGVEIGVASVHMPTLRFGLRRFLGHDSTGLRLHLDWWDHEVSRLLEGLAEFEDLPLLIGGDFNVPSDESSMVDLRSRYQFGFEEAGWGYGYTRPARYPWFRIDHILASPSWIFTRCWAGPNLGSDHLPLLAEAVLPAQTRRPEESE